MVSEDGLETDTAGEVISEAPIGSSSGPGGSPEASSMQPGDNVCLSLSQWFSVVLLKLRLQYRLSNSVMVLILNIIALLLAVVSHPLQCHFPTTIFKLFSTAKVNQDPSSTETYVVCPACSHLYCFSDLTKTMDDSEHHCQQLIHSRRCNEPLLYRKNLSFGKFKWIPFKTFHFCPPSHLLHLFFRRQHFFDLISAPMDDPKNLPPFLNKGIWDVWHGKIWKDLKDSDGQEYFSKKCNLGLTLNVDWFRPFSHSPYKVGVMFMSILNLPRHQRMKQRWTMLVGIIPGPSEPKLDINTFLTPLVKDLERLWSGVEVMLSDGTKTSIRAALVCVACDLPASRKVAQFLGHKAGYRCNKCLFKAERQQGTQGASGKMSYYTQRLSSIPKRNGDDVRQQAEIYRAALTKTEKDRLARSNGVRYTELLRLPYFDAVRMVVVDAMHAFFLGLVSHEVDLILGDSHRPQSFSMSSDNRGTLKERVKAIGHQLPLDIGRLPGKIFDVDGRSKTTAAQWKHFILLYDRPCFINLVSPRVYKSIKLLAEVVELLTDESPTEETITYTENKIFEHHEAFCHAYGKWYVTVNYHMALHTADCIRDFGPANNFWLFPYERENAVVGGSPTNGVPLEKQLFNRYHMQYQLEDAYTDPDEMPQLPPLLPHLEIFLEPWTEIIMTWHFGRWLPSRLQLPAATQINQHEGEELMSNQLMLDAEDEEDLTQSWPITLYHHPSRKEFRVAGKVHEMLIRHFEIMYSEKLVCVSRKCDLYARCGTNGSIFSSEMNRTDRTSAVMAYWTVLERGEEFVTRPYIGRVNFFLQIPVYVKEPDSSAIRQVMHTLAKVHWVKPASPQVDPESGLLSLKKTMYAEDHFPFITPRRLICRCVVVEIGRKCLAEQIS